MKQTTSIKLVQLLRPSVFVIPCSFLNFGACDEYWCSPKEMLFTVEPEEESFRLLITAWHAALDSWLQGNQTGLNVSRL